MDEDDLYTTVTWHHVHIHNKIMCMFVFLCLCVCISVCVCAYLYVCVRVCMFVCVHICMCVCPCVHVCVCVCAYLYVCEPCECMCVKGGCGSECVTFFNNFEIALTFSPLVIDRINFSSEFSKAAFKPSAFAWFF